MQLVFYPFRIFPVMAQEKTDDTHLSTEVDGQATRVTASLTEK